jgi:hypothetical protein
LFDGHPVGDTLHGLLSGDHAVNCAWDTPGGQHRHGPTTPSTSSTPHPDPFMIPVVREALSSPIANHRHPLASGTLSRQPFHVCPIGLASFTGKWDKYDHSRRESASWSRTRPRHTAPWRRFRSYVSHSKLKKNQALALYDWPLNYFKRSIILSPLESL